jgi:hypothetical protein
VAAYLWLVGVQRCDEGVQIWIHVAVVILFLDRNIILHDKRIKLLGLT